MSTNELISQTKIANLSPQQILNYIPQQAPFRFVDQIINVNEHEITGTYTFKKNEYFYSGHFPNKPITPGVILLECMCQIGVVAFGIYLLSLEVPIKEITNWITMFTDAKVDFLKSVYPGDVVLIKAKKIFWRKMKLRTDITMYDNNLNLLATASASGVGIRV